MPLVTLNYMTSYKSIPFATEIITYKTPGFELDSLSSSSSRFLFVLTSLHNNFIVKTCKQYYDNFIGSSGKLTRYCLDGYFS